MKQPNTDNTAGSGKIKDLSELNKFYLEINNQFNDYDSSSLRPLEPRLKLDNEYFQSIYDMHEDEREKCELFESLNEIDYYLDLHKVTLGNLISDHETSFLMKHEPQKKRELSDTFKYILFGAKHPSLSLRYYESKQAILPIKIDLFIHLHTHTCRLCRSDYPIISKMKKSDEYDYLKYQLSSEEASAKIKSDHLGLTTLCAYNLRKLLKNKKETDIIMHLNSCNECHLAQRDVYYFILEENEKFNKDHNNVKELEASYKKKRPVAEFFPHEKY